MRQEKILLSMIASLKTLKIGKPRNIYTDHEYDKQLEDIISKANSLESAGTKLTVSTRRKIKFLQNELNQRKERYTNSDWLLKHWIKPLFRGHPEIAKLVSAEEFVQILQMNRNNPSYNEFMLSLKNDEDFIIYSRTTLIKQLLFIRFYDYSKKEKEFNNRFIDLNSEQIRTYCQELINLAEKYIFIMNNSPGDEEEWIKRITNKKDRWQQYYDEADTIKFCILKERWRHNVIRLFEGLSLTQGDKDQLSNILERLWNVTFEVQKFAFQKARAVSASNSVSLFLMMLCLYLESEEYQLPDSSLYQPLFFAIVILTYLFNFRKSTTIVYNSDNLHGIPALLTEEIFQKMIRERGVQTMGYLIEETEKLEECIERLTKSYISPLRNASSHALINFFATRSPTSLSKLSPTVFGISLETLIKLAGMHTSQKFMDKYGISISKFLAPEPKPDHPCLSY